MTRPAVRKREGKRRDESALIAEELPLTACFVGKILALRGVDELFRAIDPQRPAPY